MKHPSRVWPSPIRSAIWPVPAAMVVASVALAAPPPAVAAARDRPVQTEAYAFAFKDADIAQVAAEILGNTLRVPYMVDPAVTGKMSFRIEQRLTAPQLLEAFEAALSANDTALVRDGDTVRIVPLAKAKAAATIRTADEGVHHAGYEVVAVPLAYAAPTEVAKALDSIDPSKAVLYANDKQGLLILGGSGQELESALQTVKVFDRSTFEGAKIRWVELEKAPAMTVAADLDKMLTAAGVTGVGVVPLKRLNGLFLFARTAAALDETAGWVAKLDEPSAEKTASLYVYHPHNSSAEALSKTLNSVLSGQTATDQTQTTAQQKGPGVAAAATSPATATVATQSQSFLSSGEDAVRIGVDRETNTLLISAPAGQWIQLQRILQEIDKAPNQILIEASILEVTLTKDFQFGVDWSLMGYGHTTVSSINNKSGTVGPNFPGMAVTFLNKDISAAVNTLGSKTNVEVVSAPKIMALDNHTAKLDVGDQVPIVTQTAQSTSAGGAPLVSSVDYRSTGVILNVTPRITGEDRITLDVEQEVSDASETTTSGISSPTISQRKFESTLIIQDGGVVALGGLISTNRTVGDTGVPLLMDVPGLGALFKSNNRSNSRTELIVLLSARIVRDEPGAKHVMADLLADMHEIDARGLIKTAKP